MDATFSVRRSSFARTAAAIVVATTLIGIAACGGNDVGAAKLKSLPKAAHRAQIVAAMGNGPFVASNAKDSVRVVSGYRAQRFVSGGKLWEVLWYRDQPGTLDDEITKTTDTPIVIESDTLVGWGWSFYGPFSGAHKLPDPSTNATRRDSISKSQCPAGKVCTNGDTTKH